VPKDATEILQHLHRTHLVRPWPALAAFLIPLLSSGAHAYQNSEYGFSLTPPEGWPQVENPYVLAVFESSGGAGYSPRISINVVDRTRTDLDALVAQITASYLALFTDFSVLSQENTTLLGLPARRMVCSWTQGMYQLKMTEILVQKVNRYYDLGLITVESQHGAHRSEFDESVDTLRLFDGQYYDLERGVGVVYPSGWAVDDQSLPGMVLFYGPELDGFLTNVVLASESWNQSLKEYLDYQRSQMTEMMTDLHLLGEGTLSLPSGIWGDLTYTYRIPGPMTLQARAAMVVRGGAAYSLVYTSLPDVYDTHLPEFNKILSTFSIAEGIVVLVFPLISLIWALPRFCGRN
jgi:hypothetical protein